MKLRRIGTIVLVVLTTGGILAACAEDDKPRAAASKTARADRARVREVTITVDEQGSDSFSYENVPATIEAGVVRLRLDNSSGAEPHDLQLARIEPGHTLAELTEQAADQSVPFPSWLEEATGVGVAAPGRIAEATVELTEGTWAFFCTELTEQPSGPPVSHATHGMAGTFEVDGDASGVLPETDTTIATGEYTFDVKGIEAGENVVEFRNDGGMFHHVVAFPMTPGTTFADVQKAFASDDRSAPPPLDFTKGIGTAVLGPGQRLVTTLDLPVGDYVLICFIPDSGTAGPPHLAKGMLQELKLG